MNKKKLVVLSGAGISAESGISTFRDSNGLWENHRIEDVATPEAWKQNPELVNTFYNMRRKQVLEVHPNLAHSGLVELEKHFEVIIITQNIDDLHERAGSSHVIHLHGEILKMRCEVDATDIHEIKDDITITHTSVRGHRLRPHIVWFGEEVPEMMRAVHEVENADVFVVIGTSLNVYPAAGLLSHVNPETPIYIIDKSIPKHNPHPKLTSIEKTAGEGISDLKKLLLTDE